MSGSEKVDIQRRGPSRLVMLWLLASCWHTPPASAEDVATKPFSQEERTRLASGQLVSRPVTEQRAALRLIGGSAWQVINAPPAAVFQALLETRYYPRLLPTVSGAALISEHPELRRVRLEHKKGPLGISYRLALRVDAKKRDIGFKLNDPLDSGVRAAWGFLSVQAYGSQRTLLSYGVMADPGEGLLVGLARGMIHEWLLRVPEQVRKFMEGATGRTLYVKSAVSGAVLSSARGRGQFDSGLPQQRAP